MDAFRTTLVAALVSLGAWLTIPSSAFAAPGANDGFANATAVTSLPFTDSGDLNGTTTEAGEPQFCNFMSQTVWYSFTPSTSQALKVDLNGSDFGVVLNVYRSFSPGIFGLGFDGCLGFGGSTELNVDAGTTYYFQAGSVSFGPAHLQLNLQPVPPPANDDFGAATPIGSVPFSDNVDRTSATEQPGEPVFTSCGPISHTVWYAFTPSTSGSYFASGNAPGVNSMMTLYTGSAVASLTPLACGQSDRLLFHADAGTTYSIQVGSYDGQPGATQSFSLTVAPSLAMAAFSSPQDPSIYDDVQFYDETFDPAGPGTIAKQHWAFGDGTSADGCCVTHRYPADGTYTATLTDTTVDGRTGTTSLTVTVKTHDVAIAKFLAPQTASIGQTRTISVGVSNRRYPETVQVQLFKSVAGGSFQLVGSLTQSVPVLSANRTASFDIAYTFVDPDRAAGKVTFEAVASIVGGHDAVPADNTAIAPPTVVTR